ncbi:uncharacterized protein LOC106667968 isoform X1 [Cimex lectularius]|uniref:Uncharacterized protein n=1 Tax=Cimex lectularius TaxID=79782 RepID=A0A8I6RXW1_CIMLE|nr:uncharacterized protein LOC106667968 isoform X1 [Cimex lectularius]XP_014251797.1 uncharacterized protein LOC106667968 isoform X1 [Cimex lectularius]
MTSNRNDSVIGKSSSLLKKPSKISSRNEEKKPNIFRRIQNMVAGLFSVCMSSPSKRSFSTTPPKRQESLQLACEEKLSFIARSLHIESRKSQLKQQKKRKLPPTPPPPPPVPPPFMLSVRKPLTTQTDKQKMALVTKPTSSFYQHSAHNKEVLIPRVRYFDPHPSTIRPYSFSDLKNHVNNPMSFLQGVRQRKTVVQKNLPLTKFT